MKRVRFNKANVLAHIENTLELLEATHGERITWGYHNIHIMAPGEHKDRLMRAWGEYTSLNRLRWAIEGNDLKEL